MIGTPYLAASTLKIGGQGRGRGPFLRPQRGLVLGLDFRVQVLDSPVQDLIQGLIQDPCGVSIGQVAALLLTNCSQEVAVVVVVEMCMIE
jgi:hypothetical protein